MTRAFVGLGSNLGCKVGNIRRAVRLLEKVDGIHNLVLSSFYKTEPVGKLDQDWFVNAVARFETTFCARKLLDVCLGVEKELKRVRDERWGPRTLDIDLLYFGDEVVLEDALQVPHPRVRERAFVLKPLLELDPRLAWDGVPLGDSLEGVSGQGIEKMIPAVAILGASERPGRYSNMAQRSLVEEGHRVALVAPRGEEVLGVPVLRRLVDCDEPVDTVTLYVGSARVESVLADLLEACPRRVIFNPGTENEGVRSSLELAGIETLEACTLVMLRTGQF